MPPLFGNPNLVADDFIHTMIILWLLSTMYSCIDTQQRGFQKK